MTRIEKVYGALERFVVSVPCSKYLKDPISQINTLSQEQKARDSPCVVQYILPLIRLYIRIHERYRHLRDDDYLALSERLQQLSISFPGRCQESEQLVDRIIDMLPDDSTFQKTDGSIESILKTILKKQFDQYIRNKYYVALSRWTHPNDARRSYPQGFRRLLKQYHKKAQQKLEWRTRQFHYDDVNHALQKYTELLQGKCGKDYSFLLRLDQEMRVDVQQQQDSWFQDYHENFLKRDAVLCVMHGTRCISSIKMSVNDKYGDNQDDITVELYSDTLEEYQRRYFNLILTALSIIICPILNKRITTIAATASNPISAWIVEKYFHFENETQMQQASQGSSQGQSQGQGSSQEQGLSQGQKQRRKQRNRFIRKYEDRENNVEYKLDITNKENINNAERVFLLTLEKMCKRPERRNSQQMMVQG